MPSKRTKRTKIRPSLKSGEKASLNRHWRADFLDSLAETSNVSEAARRAGINPARAYKVRREEADFARSWMRALWEGYVHLEFEVLRRLREGDLQTAAGEKYDFANAIRLLTAHRDNAARVQAEQRNVRLVKGWDWSEQGVDLSLERVLPSAPHEIDSHKGDLKPPPDLHPMPTKLRFLELPWDGSGSSDDRQLYAGLSSGEGWSGANLYYEMNGGLVPIGVGTTERAVLGSIQKPLPPSPSIHFESAATIELQVEAADYNIHSTTMVGLLQGENRALIGDEVIQFLGAEQTGSRRWILKGLLRGRGGTESSASAGHSSGTPFVLLDEALQRLDGASIPYSAETRLAAMGFGDEQPVLADIEMFGQSRRPLAPVHLQRTETVGSDVTFSWKRRARGQWQWTDYVDTPLIEEREVYLVGIGSNDDPLRVWEIDKPNISFSKSELDALSAAHPGQSLWVCQLGTYAHSHPAILATFA